MVFRLLENRRERLIWFWYQATKDQYPDGHDEKGLGRTLLGATYFDGKHGWWSRRPLAHTRYPRPSKQDPGLVIPDSEALNIQK